MSGTFGKLFGTPSNSSSSSSTPTTYKTLSPAARKLYDNTINTAQGFTPEMFAPAPLTAQQNQAIEYFSSPTETITPEQFQSGLSIFSNPFEEQVLQNSIRDINDQARGGWSDIASFASDIGGFGSDRRGVLEAELQKNLLRTIGDISASSRAANFENATDRTLNEIGNVRNINQSKMGSLFDIGSTIQNQNTATRNAPVSLNNYLSSLAAMLQGGGAKSSSSAIGEDPGMIARLTTGMQNVGKLAGGAAGLFP